MPNNNRALDFLNAVWSRFEVPGSNVSAEFPYKPVSETERHGDEVTTTLYLERHGAQGAFRFDLAVTSGRPRELPTSEHLADELKSKLGEEREFEVLSVVPRSFGASPGAVQRMKLRETGEVLSQWVICERERTIFAGLTVFENGFEEIGTRFFNSVSTEKAAKPGR